MKNNELKVLYEYWELYNFVFFYFLFYVIIDCLWGIMFFILRI